MSEAVLGLANTATAFAVLFSGLLALAFCRWLRPQPKPWLIVYSAIVITGVFTVTLHGFGETCGCFGPRWIWAWLDTGSNLVVTYLIAMAIIGELFQAGRRWQILLSVLLLIALLWHGYDRWPGTPRIYALPLGDWGGFYPGEAFLVAYAWLNLGLFIAMARHIPAASRTLLNVLAATFFVGMLLASAGSTKVVAGIFAVHATWHIVAAAGFLLLWAFNDSRFHGHE